MIAAFDVHYHQSGGAQAAAVVFGDYADAMPTASYVEPIAEVAEYQPGEFYRRELPCLLAALAKIVEPVSTIIIDGYVMLGDKPGLGRHLYDALGDGRPVIGVAKTHYEGSRGIEVLRGGSERPLFVTALGMPETQAAECISAMHGPHRIPTLLKEVDRLCRGVDT